jgi:hypothetical protein
MGADAEEYWLWSAAIAAGESTSRPFFLGPLYPYFLAAIRLLPSAGLAVVLCIQACLGAAATVLIADAVQAVTKRRLVAGIVGMLIAGYEMSVFFDGSLLMESLLFTLESLFLWVLVRPWSQPRPPLALTIGVLVGLLAAGRATNLLLLPIAVWWTHATSREFRRAATLSVAVIVGASAVILPITVRNYLASGELIPLTYNGGYNFFIGFNADATGSYVVPTETFNEGRDRGPRDGTGGDGRTYLEAQTGERLSPNQSSAEWRRRAMDWIREHPHQALRLAARKVVMMWNKREYFQLDNPLAVRSATGRFGWPGLGSFAFLGALGIAGLFALRGVPRGVVWGYCGSVTLAGASFFVTDRYRLHLVPAIAIAAGAYLSAVLDMRWGPPKPRGLLLVVTLIVGAGITQLPAPGYDRIHAAWDAAVSTGDAYLAHGDASTARPYYTDAIHIVESGQLRGIGTSTARLAVAGLYENAAVVHMLVDDAGAAIPLLQRAQEFAPGAAGPTLRIAEAMALAHRCEDLRELRGERSRFVEHLLTQHAQWLRVSDAAGSAIVDGMLCLDPRNLEAWTLRIYQASYLPNAPLDDALRAAAASGISQDRLELLTAYARTLQGRLPEAEKALDAAGAHAEDPAILRLLGVIRRARTGWVHSSTR